MQYRLATSSDCIRIAWLYHEVYEGNYPQALMKDLSAMQRFLNAPNNYWFVAEKDNEIVGSVVYSVHPSERYAKVFGAVVHEKVRGYSISYELAQKGYEYLLEKDQIDLVYVLTRTVHEAAQIVIERLGYKKLGVFPNVHKSENYETHCLAAIFSKKALELRNTEYQIHYKIKKLADIVCEELKLPLLNSVNPEAPSRQLQACPPLELIDAPCFAKVQHRKHHEQKNLIFEFHSLEPANIMIVSEDQQVEVFANLAHNDGHCEILGAKVPSNISYNSLLLQVAQILRDHGARYIEIGIEASRPKIVESVIKAKFVPCAFFPAFGRAGEKRVDYILLSRTFENFDFKSLQFRGLNQKYLSEYFTLWKEISLTQKLLEE